MASKPRLDPGECDLASTASKTGSSSSSESSGAEEEERLRRLFQACDRDQDGFIDSHDLMVMCQQLNMEDAIDEIIQQLGADEKGRISFDEFLQCRYRLIAEIEQEKMRERGLVDLPVHLSPKEPVIAWPAPPRNGLGVPGMLSSGRDPRETGGGATSLFKLMEGHDPEALRQMLAYSDTLAQRGGPNFAEVANTLHLAALTSLKGEIIDLSGRLQHVTAEKEVLEKQLNKQQSDKLRIQRDVEDRLEQQTQRYEERITELHSVIAELRKKIDRHQINVIREEEEYEESDGVQSNKSNDDASLNENNANESQATSVADLGTDLNAELSRVVSELESAIDERKKITVEAGQEATPESPPLREADDNIEEKTLQVCKEMENMEFSTVPPPMPEIHEMEAELARLSQENTAYQEHIGRQETELNKLRAQLGGIREERDRLKRRVRELATRLQSVEASSGSPLNSRTSTPTKSPVINPNAGERCASGSEQQVPIAKLAGLKKLKTGGGERQVLGAELSSCGLPNAKVAEHLVQSLQECSNVQEISQTLSQAGNSISDSRIEEFEIEFERLTSKIDHLKSQNDLLTLTLEESKAHCDRLTVLIGKYESNSTALQLAMNFSEQTLEAYDVLVSLMESELGMLLANCRAAGLGSSIGQHSHEGGEAEEHADIASVVQNATAMRRAVEHVAKQLLLRLDRSAGVVHLPGTAAPSPWEELSSNSRTGSTTSSTASSADTEFSKMDEAKLRDYIRQLKSDRASVKLTMLELESVHIDPLEVEMGTTPETQRLDLENAVIMQELMAMKEEKAELKAQNYLLDKEKSALELQLSGKQSQEQAYLVQIDHLKCELKEQIQRFNKWRGKEDSSTDTSTPAITLAELRSHNASDIAQDLSESLKRERKLKTRVQELVATLEKLSKNSEIRHQQSAEFVNDLKRANSALVTAFEKAKKKYQSKVKKLESQMQAIQERHEAQIRILKQRLTAIEEENSRPPTNETSL